MPINPPPSIDDKQPCTPARRGAMRLGAIRHLVTHARLQREAAAIGELGVELAFEAQENVALGAPVIRDVTGGVLEHAHAHVAEMASAPACLAARPCVCRHLDLVPVDRAKGQVAQVHPYLPASTSANTFESTFPPLRVMPTRWPASDSRSRQAAANAAAPAPSATLCVIAKMRRMPAASSASDTSTMRLTFARMMDSASGSGRRQAMPSPRKVVTGASTTRRAAKERAKVGAWSDTTPTIFVRGDQMLRAAAQALMPEPWPIGT